MQPESRYTYILVLKRCRAAKRFVVFFFFSLISLLLTQNCVILINSQTVIKDSRELINIYNINRTVLCLFKSKALQTKVLRTNYQNIRENEK